MATVTRTACSFALSLTRQALLMRSRIPPGCSGPTNHVIRQPNPVVLSVREAELCRQAASEASHPRLRGAAWRSEVAQPFPGANPARRKAMPGEDEVAGLCRVPGRLCRGKRHISAASGFVEIVERALGRTKRSPHVAVERGVLTQDVRCLERLARMFAVIEEVARQQQDRIASTCAHPENRVGGGSVVLETAELAEHVSAKQGTARAAH